MFRATYYAVITLFSPPSWYFPLFPFAICALSCGEQEKDKQALRRAATETAALIHMFRYKVPFLFHLEITFGDEVDIR